MYDNDVVKLSFNYTARDFASVREELRLLLLREIPEWVDTPASFEGVLMDQFAYVADILHFYVDRLGSEAYLQSAVRRESVLNIAYLFGYVPAAQTAARGDVTFTKADGLGDVIVPAGTQVFAQVEGFDPIIFETTLDRIISDATLDIAVEEGVTVAEELMGVSTGDPSMAFGVFNDNVIKGSVRVFTKDGNVSASTGEPSLVEWRFAERIIDGEFFDRVFSLELDAGGFTFVRFGDGVSGSIPSTGVEIYITYRYGQGVDGNVAAGSVRSLVSGGDLVGRVKSVSNGAPLQGGSDAESIESMRKSIPKSIRAVERAVTLEDFASLAVRVGGVAKAVSNAQSSVTSVQLAIAPVGGGDPSETLLADTELYLDKRKMVGVGLVVIPPVYVPVNVSATIQVNARYRNSEVRESAQAAITSLFDFDNVEFGQRVTKAGVFRVTVDQEGVEYVEITAFNRDGAGSDADFVLAYNELPTAGSMVITATGGITPT
jgi:hypothetical protein